MHLKKIKIKKKLEEIKNATPNILDFNINGEDIKNFKEEDLINLGLKLGERKKLLNYLSSIKQKVENKIDIRITESSTVD